MRETGTGQQVAHFHERLMMIKIDFNKKNEIGLDSSG
jgi:hypothetical protein